jgi:hypothetical protein
MPGHGKQIHWHCIRQGCSYVDNGGQVFVMGICPKPADLKPF